VKARLAQSPLFIVLVLGLVAAGIFGIPKLLEEAGISGDPWTFEETLPEVTDDFGDDAKVVSISVIGGSVSYEVIGDDGLVHTRDYTVETESLSGGGQGRTRRTDNSERPATAKDIAAAKVTLGELDEDVVEQMWEEADFPAEGSSAALTGSEWALSTGARPFDQYLANADGSDVRQTKSKEDTFGPGAQAGPEPQGIPDPGGQAEKLQALGDCIQAAGTDIAAIQKCQATATP
jgi:hypothetical protein